MAAATTFDPNRHPFQVCVDAVDQALKALGMTRGKDLLTSTDQHAAALRAALKTDNLPNQTDFVKWQLPFIMETTNWFITVTAPGAKTPQHSHNQGAGVRFVVGGSMTLNGRDYHTGDWIYLPARTPYEYEAGPNGLVLLAGYQC